MLSCLVAPTCFGLCVTDMGNLSSLAKGESGEGAHIAAENLACVRGEKLLFRALNFACEAGSGLHVTGANGTGKSSLMRLLAGLLRPYAGAVHMTGSLALSDERLALDTHWTLENALGFWAQVDGADKAKITAALEAVDMPDLADVPVRYFSTGQRKRAALARVLVSGADIWLLDEPANGLDAASVERLGALMQAHLDGGGIIIAASHQPLPLAHPIQLPLEDFQP